MKLVSIKMKNFRAYNGEHKVYFDENFSSFVGKNDSGKSTIFEALDIFFGNDKPDLNDLSVDSHDKNIEFTCEFKDLPDSITIDTSAETSLKDEFLLNADGLLEMKKVYKCTNKTISTKPEIFIIANHPSGEQVVFLHTQNNKALKELCIQKGVIDNVTDKKINNLLRTEIWGSIDNLELIESSLKIDDFDTKAKQIYSNIMELIPLFFLFKSDRETTDADSEAKDPMQLAVAEAQEVYKDSINEIKEKIQDQVDAVADSALEKLKEMHPELARQLKPVLKSKPSWKFDYRIEDDRGVAINKRGSGTRRLVLLNFFRAQAEKKVSTSGRGIIYAIEEPETSQHPDNQELILKTLGELSDNPNRQIMITTHSAELLSKIKTEYKNGIRFIQVGSNDEKEIITGEDALILSAEALGILSNQDFDSTEKIVLVEGKVDCLFLELTADIMKKDGEIDVNFTDKNIQVLPVGGCSGVKEWIEKSRYKDLGLSTVVFLDSDRESEYQEETANEKFIKELSENDDIGLAFCTKKREIENYIKKELTGCEFGDYDDIKSIVPAGSKAIEAHWSYMTSDDIDNEIKDIIKQIIDLEI